MNVLELIDLLEAENPNRQIYIEVEGQFLVPVADYRLIEDDKIELLPEDDPEEEE